MFHWGNREYAEEKLVQNAIDEFAYTITRRFVASDDESIESQEKFLDSYSVLPGMVKTKQAYHQAAHTDFNSWGLIVHMPLSREGMMLMIWDGNREVMGKGEYHYIPFGCYFVLPLYITHSGYMARKGTVAST